PVKASDVFFEGRAVPFTDPYIPMMSKNPENIVRKNILIAGWLADPDVAINCMHTGDTPPVVYAAEDYHYNLILDADFIAQMYGPGGLSSALNGAVLPGNLSETNPPFVGPSMRFDDVSELDGSSRGVTMNSFALPHMGGALGDSELPVAVQGYADVVPNDYHSQGPVFVHCELNCWHVNSGPPFPFSSPYWGRGPAPAGWVQWAACNEPFNDAWWPYLPYNPDNGPRPLQTGDYVLMKGTIWQEHAHDQGTPSLWRAEAATLMHCGLIEMHPPDWIMRVQPPPICKTSFMVAYCTARSVTQSPTTVSGDALVYPYPYLQSPPGSNAGFHWQKLIDGRFSYAGTFKDQESVSVGTDGSVTGLKVNATVQATNVQGRFKAIYETWWEMPLMASCFPDSVAIGSKVSFRVYAEDSSNHAHVVGTVKANGISIGVSDTDIVRVFEAADLPLTFSAPPNFSDIPLPLYLSNGLLTVNTSPITLNALISVIVTATNAAGEPVTKGDVFINNVKVGILGQPFKYKFVGFFPPVAGKPLSEHATEANSAAGLLGPPPGGGPAPHMPSGTVKAPGYQTATIQWNVEGQL
ncbi:MAG TPA: hypothetical protein VIK39_02635, partial [Candidatus Angelobacter sp.]